MAAVTQPQAQLLPLKDRVTEVLSSLPDSKSQLSPTERDAALRALTELHNALQTPELLIQKLVFGPHSLAATQVAISMGIFKAFEKAGFAPLTAAQIAKSIDGDEVLIVRIMRMLISNGIFSQTEDGTYHPLEVAPAIATVPSVSGTITHFYQQTAVFGQLDAYFHKINFRNPEDSLDAPFQFAMGTKEHAFGYISKHPEMQIPFNDAMEGNKRLHGQDWFEYFPVEQKLLEAGKEGPLLVEIGGGTGQNIASLLSHYPKLQGRVILQDLPSVVEQITEPLTGIEVQAYDMFQPNPVKGARSYYFRSVLHDFPKKDALAALKNVYDAMTDDSLLFINESIMPEVKAPGFSAQIDITMMAAFAALERTEKQWRELLQDAGFEVTKVWRGEGDGKNLDSALIEAAKKK